MKNKYALIGEKLGHSYSPMIHKMIFERFEIDGEYSLIEVAHNNLAEVVKKLRGSELLGINITIPYKTDILEYLDEISEEAKQIGAVNTVMSKGGRLIGYNTDYYGFKMIISKLKLEVKNKKNFICGGGGSARAVVKCLEDLGGENYLVTRDTEKARINFQNFQDLNIISYNELRTISEKNLIVNCTPCGMHPNIECSILDIEEKKEYQAGIDLIYNPQKTKFLEGFEVGENGLLMLVGQAVKAEEIWQEREMPEGDIQEIYEKIKGTIYKK
ncbi:MULTISPECIES: shikimate dehydrogenase family protein [Psychrilyobacter]|uniref:Shikimate dehydrogenase n=1 Tax=Psychrilyobacter piezotolerans TaxID=2293438 RepID=A0ABX9KKF1_9FUSO|nr:MULTISPECIES: shikimate dehydrogenase [Psychrilyobacter]MCS5421003.1 shikimate dehydrogenase [Psychrilyobacter sp. S5]NDI76713.1 shikimate dehydrogenase [Psychrilyobacter piezotolerans]RDE65334.1 shikimate dehydrogenase [Psychrilyobacter sp. S5]REI42952.1 shikimate dehydrogenase [Psychrilyobacter piezotolerans]